MQGGFGQIWPKITRKTGEVQTAEGCELVTPADMVLSKNRR